VESAASQRLALQVDGLMADARTAAAGGAYDRALEILGTIATIAPGRADAAALEGESLRGKAASLERAGDFMGAVLVYGRAIALAPGDSAAAAGELRCRAESDRRAARSARIRQDVAAAVAALAAGDLRAASEGFAHVLALDPGDREAAAMLERTVRAIAARGESYTRQARRSLEAGALDQAGEFLRAARALDPHASGLAEMEAALARARPGRVAEGADAASILPRAGAGGSSDARPKPVARHPGREVDDLYRRGLAAMAERRPDDALRYFELVQSLSPGYQRAVEYLKREYLTRGMEHFAAGRVEEAMSHWQKALAVDPADERTRGYLARAYTQIARTRELTGGSR
jgi:tetratricopeptide (TPR) repeat protein